MQFVDTHCHIQSVGRGGGEKTTTGLWARSSLSSEEVIGNAHKSSVGKMICVGCDVSDSELAVNFVKTQDSCWASIGIHPHEAKDCVGQAEKLKVLSSLAKEKKVVAVGECGLDYYYNHSPKQDQIEVLRFQIELALANNLPIIFHVREAFDDFWPIIASYKRVKGVLHSFTDSIVNMNKAVDQGLYVGVNGIATFAKEPKQLEVYRSIPLGSLVLETDAPFLTPVPLRGKVNEPKNIPLVAKFLAELRGEKLETIASETTKNAEKLFGGL